MQDQVKTDDFNIAMSLGGLKADVAHLTTLITTSNTTATAANAGMGVRVDAVETDVSVLKTDVAILKNNAPDRLTWKSLLAGVSGIIGIIVGGAAIVVYFVK